MIVPGAIVRRRRCGGAPRIVLPSQLRHNGLHAPIALYRGNMATTSQWTALVGSDLPTASTGNDPTIVSSPVYGQAPQIDNTGKVFQESASATGKIGPLDGIFELVVEFGVFSALETLMGTYVTDGWIIQRFTASGLVFLIDDGPTSASALDFSAADSTRLHLMVFADKSGSAYWFINGAAGGSGSISAVGDCDNSNKFTVAASVGLAQKSSATFDHLAIWSGSGLVDPTGSAMADTAAQRFASLPPLN